MIVLTLAHNEFSASCFQDICLFAAQIIFAATFVRFQFDVGAPPKSVCATGGMPLTTKGTKNRRGQTWLVAQSCFD
jgi:hypothetical protein